VSYGTVQWAKALIQVPLFGGADSQTKEEYVMADMISDLSDAELDFVTGGLTVTGNNNNFGNGNNSQILVGDNSTQNFARERERGNNSHHR